MYEQRARLVVAAVLTEEALVRAGHLLCAVGLERLDLLVARAALALALEPVSDVGMACEALGETLHLGAEARDRVAESRVDQADLDRVPRPDRGERSARELGGLLSADAARKQVGPVLRPVQPAHVLVVRVEHDVLAGDHVVGRDRERNPAGSGVARQRGDRDVRVGLDDLADDVVDRVEVVEGLLALVGGRLDHVEVDAVGEEVRPAGEHDHLGRAAAARVLVGLAQAAALLGAHRAVVEVEVQVADARLLLVGDLAVGMARWDRGVEGDRDLRRVRHDAGQLERAGGGELVRGLRVRVLLLEMRDPHGAVDGRAADRAVARGDDVPRTAAEAALGIHVEQEELDAGDRVEHAGMTLGGADLADHGGGRVAAPVDRAVGLLDQRAQPAGHVRIVVVERERLEVTAREVVDREHQHLDRGAAHLVAVDAALANRPHAELAGLPDVAGVGLLDGLEHGHAPLLHAELDRPVERRGTAVAVRTRMDDEAGVLAPHRLGDELLEHRAHDEVGLVRLDGGLDDLARVDDLDGDVVPHLGEGDVATLAQAVMRGRHEQDAQRLLCDRRRDFSTQASGAAAAGRLRSS